MPFVKNLGKTNMLTHIPEDIKLELKDGVLTLKAGSKVYVPNGFEKVTKYYKDVVTTKYWKEITTGSKELEYACYTQGVMHVYAKAPIGEDMRSYSKKDNSAGQVVSSDELYADGINFASLTEEKLSRGYFDFTRYTAGDLYIDTTTTTVVEGTPEDYTYTTEETETIEVTADDDWTRSEEVDTTVKKFDVVVIESDLISYADTARQAMGLYTPSKGIDSPLPMAFCYSGSNAPTVFYGDKWAFWYDTTNNLMKKTVDAGVTWETGCSLPIYIATETTTAYTSIDQVFNGFGYIGSTVFALPNVKGLIPDGFNADGTLKSIEFTNPVVRTTYATGTLNFKLALSTTGLGVYTYAYDEIKNAIYRTDTGAYYPSDRLIVGDISYTSGVITSFTPKKVGEGVIKNKLYQLAANKRTYYKYEYQDFVQPILTANGTLGGKSFAVAVDSRYDDYSAYKALDGDTSTSWQSNGTTAAGTYFKMYNPNPLNITKIVWSGTPKYGTITAGIVYGSNDDSDYVELATFTGGTTSGGTMDLSSNTNYYKYYKITPTTWTDKSGTYTNGWAELTITAQEQIAVEVNLNGEDVWEDWKQPVLSANGTMGGDKFAVAASSVLDGAGNHQPYTSFNEGEISTDYWHSTSGHPSYIEWYNPNPLLITNIKVTNRHSGGAHINSYIVSYSDNYSAWTQVISGTSPNQVDYGEWNIVITESKPHKYWRLTSVSSSGSNSSYTAVGKIDITAQELVKVGSTDYDYYTDKFLSYAPIVRGKRSYFKQAEKQRDTGTYTFTLDKDYTAKMLFVGNGGGGCSSQKDSRWHYSSGGSGACFEGLVRLPAGTYTLTIGSLGYGNNANNTHYHSSSVVSTDSFLTNSAGQELIRVGAGGNGYTSVGGVGGAAGVLTLGTLDILETKKATDGVYTAGNTSVGSVSAYDGTYSGYGAGTCGTRGAGNVYGIAGIFDLVLETDINDFDWYVDVATKVY